MCSLLTPETGPTLLGPRRCVKSDRLLAARQGPCARGVVPPCRAPKSPLMLWSGEAPAAANGEHDL